MSWETRRSARSERAVEPFPIPNLVRRAARTLVLFTLAARVTSHAGVLVMKLGHQANARADLVATRMRIAQRSTA